MLFGVINIIDLIIIVLVVCAAVFVAFKVLGMGNSAVVQEKAVQITFFAEESPQYVSPNSKVGDKVWDVADKINVGTVAGIRTDTALIYIPQDDGAVLKAPKDEYESVYITVNATGTVSPYGVVISNIQYTVGHSVVLYAGEGKYFCKVYSIELAE